MTISCDYAMPFDPANPDLVRYVNYHFDADSMTVVPPTDPLVLNFVLGGGTIGAWQAPPPPDTSAADRRAAFKADANYQALLAQLKAATPAQVSTYITSNVTDLASARAMLIKIALVLALVANGS